MSAPNPLRLGVLVSGNGSNLQAILDAIDTGRLSAKVELVISNQPNARALERARDKGVAALCIAHAAFPTRAEFDRKLVLALREAGVEWVVLAGFMRVLTPEFLEAFPGRVINIHPSLLPAFPGVNAIKQAFDYGVKLTGCSVHFVDSGVDSGKIIAQSVVKVEPDDDLERLSARIHRAEHELFVNVLEDIASGRVGPLLSEA